MERCRIPLLVVGGLRRLQSRLMRSGEGRAGMDLRLCFGAPWAVADPSAWPGAQPVVVTGTTRQLQHPGDLLVQLTLEGTIRDQRLSPRWIADVVQLLRKTDPEPWAAWVRSRSRQKGFLPTFRRQLLAAGELVDDHALAALLSRLER